MLFRSDYAKEVRAKKSVDFECPVSDGSPALKDMLPKLMRVLQNALVEEGLYEKEAEAMTKTWERSYFHSEGLRILYVVPEKTTNALLPIAIDPAPTAIKRVLVGRLECITPEVEAAVEGALRDPSTAASKAEFARLGRFLEPHLRRVIATTKDETVKKSAEKLLK